MPQVNALRLLVSFSMVLLSIRVCFVLHSLQRRESKKSLEEKSNVPIITFSLPEIRGNKESG